MRNARGPGPAALLDLWERGADGSPIERALLLAAAADGAPPDPASLSIGARDALLVALRAALFGDRIDGRATCWSCGQELEFALSAAALLAHAADAAEPVAAGVDWRVRFRPPTTADLLAVAASGADTRAALLERCIVAIEGSPPAASVDAAVSDALGAADPLADVTIALDCPACGERTDAPFDIVALLWTELDAWARRTLAEVDVLARAYGWTESDVLALPPRRRAAYLALAVAP